MKSIFMKTKSDMWRVTGDKTSAANEQASRHASRVTRHGFTLIELLVVISIMALIAALLFPVTGVIKRQQYLKTATAELNQIETALDNYKAKYGIYPPSNANPGGTYAPPISPALMSQLYYELSGTMTTNNGTTFITLDSSSQIKVADVSTAYGVGGFINCSKGSGEDALAARDFLSGLSSREINNFVTNNGIQTTMLVTSVGGPDVGYKPLGASGLNPFRYNYPGTNNPTAYDLWIDLRISGKTNRISNWNHAPVIL
jgi:prepilin-type N-terminal cleavage/methylation domain-containing protein